jgi:hypothetical protein
VASKISVDDLVLELLDLLDDENGLSVGFDVFDALATAMDQNQIKENTQFDSRFMLPTIRKCIKGND